MMIKKICYNNSRPDKCRYRSEIRYRKIINCTTIIVLVILMTVKVVKMAIVPPAWADPERNPCASLPGGWQLLYWAPLKRCFKIFSLGYPCPETMELSPALNRKQRLTMNKNRKLSFKSNMNSTVSNPPSSPLAECRCPPGTVLYVDDNKCYKIFEKGPCKKNQYFAPQTPKDSTRTFIDISKRYIYSFS